MLSLFWSVSSVICLFLCVFQSQTLIFLILVHLMFINFLLPWIHRNFVFVPYFSRRSWFRWRIFGPGRTSLVRWMFFSMLRSTFIISVDQVFSPFSSVELPYFDEFIVFPSLLSSKLLISVTDFFWVILVEISNFGELFFPCVSPPYFNELFWSKFLVSVNEWCFFVLGSVETIFSFFRILISVKTVRSFGAFFFSPLIPIEILGNFLSSPWFPSKFLFRFFFRLFRDKIPSWSEISFFHLLLLPKFCFFQRFIFSPSYSSRNSMEFGFFWRFICFPAFPWNFLIVAIYFFAALFSFIRVKTPYFGDLFVIL